MLSDWQAIVSGIVAGSITLALPLPAEVGLGAYAASVAFATLVLFGKGK